MTGEQLYIKIKIKAYHPYYLNRFILLVEENIKQNFLDIDKHVYLPKKLERFTVLTSPHVDKKAREQFERVTHKRVLLINVTKLDLKNKNLLLYRLFRLFSNLSVGVSFSFKYIQKGVISKL